AAGMLPCIRYQKARVPPQPGQSKPVLNFTRQVGEVNASPLVGWSARVYATPPEKHTSTANGAAHRGLRAQNRNMNSLNRPPHPGGPVGLEVDPGHQSVAEQERQHVVPVDALRRRRVDLDPVAEFEKPLGPFPPPDHRVERAQQGARADPAG